MLFANPMVTVINRDYLIRYQYSDSNKTYLKGAGVYCLLVGQELANKHLLAAYYSTADKVTFKLRRGLTIHFITR